MAGDGKPGTIVPDGEYQWDKDRRYVEYPHSTHSSFHVILLTLSTQLFCVQQLITDSSPGLFMQILALGVNIYAISIQRSNTAVYLEQTDLDT